MSMTAVRMPTAESAPLEAFVACAHQMLDPNTSEAARRALEPRLVALLPMLRALGVWDGLSPNAQPIREILVTDGQI